MHVLHTFHSCRQLERQDTVTSSLSSTTSEEQLSLKIATKNITVDYSATVCCSLSCVIMNYALNVLTFCKSAWLVSQAVCVLHSG